MRLFKSAFFLSLALTLSCNKSQNQISNHSTALNTNPSNKLTFARFTDKQNQQRIGVMINPNTVIITKKPNWKDEIQASFIAQFGDSKVEAKHWNAIFLWGPELSFGGLGSSANGSESQPLQAYKLTKPIDGTFNIEISPQKIQSERKKFYYQDDVSAFHVMVESSSGGRFLVREVDPRGSTMKEGGVILDSDGKILGILTDTTVQQVACGPVYGRGVTINAHEAGPKSFDEARSGFPTKAEMAFVKSYERIVDAVSMNSWTPVILSGITIKAQNPTFKNPKISLQTKDCTIHMLTTSHIFFENLKESEDIYFSRKDYKINVHQLKALKNATECLGKTVWWPYKRDEKIQLFMDSLNGYIEEQKASVAP